MATLGRRASYTGAMRLWISAAVTAVVLATAPASLAAPRVVIADKGFTESSVVTQIYGLALEARGYDVVYRRAPSSAVADTALRKGSIDLYPEYTSTALVTLMNQPADANLARVLKKVSDRYAANGLIATTPTPFEDGNEVACTKSIVKRLNLVNLNTLRRHPRQIVYAANQEHLLRPDGLVVLAREYGALFKGLEIQPTDKRYDAIRSGAAQCVYAVATDPEIGRLGLTVLRDPKGAFSGTPARGFVALRKATAVANPGLQAEIDRVSRVLTTSRIRVLNEQVGIRRHAARKEAAAFLVARGIITQAQANAAGTVSPELLADAAAGGAPPAGKSARTVRVFFIRGEGRITARKRTLQAGLSAEGGVKVTMRRLLAGPTVGERTKLDLRTTIPKGTTLVDLKVRGGIAAITLSAKFLDGDDASEIAARIAQVVRTADQFTYVTSVRLVIGAGDGASWTRATGNQPGHVVTPSNPGLKVSSAGIAEIQRKLVTLKYLPTGGANGKNDYRTQQAVMAFQAWHGLQRDGLIGPATRTALATAAIPKPTIAAGRRIEVYRQKGVVLLITDGKVDRVIHASTGKPGFGTPAGDYRIYRQSERDWSYPFQVWLPLASDFTGGYAFHGYADVPATPASHGSVRIPLPEAPVVYAFATVGTIVSVY
jgi:glycine betaine/choline ABC-type transport system substrate-binding protein/lipoprotein-anchoring transpeptidase ErfK/SrfK